MQYKLVEHLIIKAINEYLKNTQTNALEIQSALLTKTLPLGLIELIKLEFRAEKAIEKRHAAAKVSKDSQGYKADQLSRFTVSEIKETRLALLEEFKTLNKKSLLITAEFNDNLERFARVTLNDIKLWAPNHKFVEVEEYLYFTQTVSSYEKHLRDQLMPLIEKLFNKDYNRRKNEVIFTRSEYYAFLAPEVCAKMAYAEQIKILRASQNNLITQITRIKERLITLDWLLTPNPSSEAQYKEVKNSLCIGDRRDLKKLTVAIKNKYDFNALTSIDIHSIFNHFVTAIRPHISSNPYFSHALEQFDAIPKRKEDLNLRKTAMIRLIDETLLALNNKLKIERLSDLKQRITEFVVNDNTVLYHLEQVITNWQLAVNEGKRNHEIFNPRPGVMSRFFHPEPEPEAGLMEKCMALARPTPRFEVPPPPSYIYKSEFPRLL